jgi:hypothetical protein
VGVEEKSDGQSAWEFYVAPFVLALAANGNVTVNPKPLNLERLSNSFALCLCAFGAPEQVWCILLTETCQPW